VHGCDDESLTDLLQDSSCVEYSTLNTEKWDIKSKSDLEGCHSPLVVLEKVCGAPWDRVHRYSENPVRYILPTI
jgi:hypothetical protein